MRCRIADVEDLAQPVAWRSVTPGFFSATDGHSRQDLPRASQEVSAEPAALSEGDLNNARQSGFQDGVKQAREEAAAAVKQTLDRLAQTLQDLAQVKRKVRNEAEHEVVKLSLAIARRILYRELSTDPESIQGIVHAALQKLQSREIIRVRVYSAAAAAVRVAFERAGQTPAVEIIADTSLATGAILFETAMGELDASVETQLQEIQRGFADRLALR